VSFFETNCAIIKKNYPGLLEEIEKEDDAPPEDIQIETTATGEYTLKIKGIYVHSPRDPAHEASRLAQNVVSGKEPVIILGFGLGYAAQAASKFPEHPVIIVEKYRSLLIKALELRDFSELLERKNIIFVPGGSSESISGALSLCDEKSPPVIIRNRTLIDLDKDFYSTIEERIRTWKIKDNVNTATLKRFGRRWVSNLSHNKTAIRDYPGVSRLVGLAAGNRPIPVFLAAAGPSLDKITPWLHEIHRRCIIVAVDTNLRFFVRNGIEPDFVLVVDPQYWNSRHLDRCVPGRTCLIAEAAVYPSVLALPFTNIFLCGSLFPFGSYIENNVDPKGKLGAGGSVATTAWDLARSLGGGVIWIAGLDLAYPGYKTHFRGASFEEKSNSGSNRFKPVESWVVRALHDGHPFYAPSSGGEVLTDQRLSLYAAWFENRFRNCNAINYSLFQDGLVINGLQSAAIETFLALPECRDEIEKRINSALHNIKLDFNQTAAERADKYTAAVAALQRGLEDIKEAAEQGAVIAQRALNRNSVTFSQKDVFRDLDIITKRIAKSDVKDVAGFLFPEIEENDDNSEPFRAYLKSSLQMYRSLVEAVSYNLDKMRIFS
jgi:hypothetical protein